MEKKVDPNTVKQYISQRDDILKIVSEDICKICTDPQKNKMAINYEDPLNCECRCNRVNNVLICASNIDSDIKIMLNQN